MHIHQVFSVRSFSTAPPSPGNARGLICFSALAFHEVTAKEDMLGSRDGRTRQDCHFVTDKQCTIRKKRNIILQGGIVLYFVGGGGRLNNKILFYLMGPEIDDATAGSTMSVVSTLVSLWFLP